MNKKFKCLVCGYIFREKEGIKSVQLAGIDVLYICPKCKSFSEEYIDEGLQEINELVNQDLEEENKNLDKECINAMKLAIEYQGNDWVWQDIEFLKNPIERLLQREYFILAGGVIPEKEIAI